MASEDKLEQVLTSMKNNKVAMKGIHTFPSCQINFQTSMRSGRIIYL